MGRSSNEPSRALGFVMGGVRFELHCAPGLPLALPRLAVERLVGEEVAAAGLAEEPTLGRVLLHASAVDDVRAVQRQPAAAERGLVVAPQGRRRSVSWAQLSTGLEVAAGQERVQLRFAAAGFSGHLRVEPRQHWLEDWACALSAAVGFFQGGGVVIHAAGVLRQTRVWGFIGPSGAGKTTAAALLDGAPFCVDRMMVWPPDDSGRCWASPLPGGNVGTLAPARLSQPRYPLAGLLRVRKAPPGGGAQVRSGGAASQLAWLRESVFFGGQSACDQGCLLQALARLIESLPVAEVSFALGAALGPALEAQVSRPGVRSAPTD